MSKLWTLARIQELTSNSRVIKVSFKYETNKLKLSESYAYPISDLDKDRIVDIILAAKDTFMTSHNLEHTISLTSFPYSRNLRTKRGKKTASGLKRLFCYFTVKVK